MVFRMFLVSSFAGLIALSCYWCCAMRPPSVRLREHLRRRQRQPPQPAGTPTTPRGTMSADEVAAAWDQLPLGVQQHILLLTGHPSARRVSKVWRDTFDAANDTLCFRHVPDPHRSLQVTATAAATRVVRNSASLTAVNYVELGYVGVRSLHFMLSDLLAAGATSGLATRLRKLTGVQVDGECAVQQLQALRRCTGLTQLDITKFQDLSAEQSRQAAAELTAALQGMRSLTHLYVYSGTPLPESVTAALSSALQPLTQLQHLHVVFSRQGAAGISALASTLSAMPGLQTLDVSYNALAGVEGAQALCTVLNVVPGLTFLDVNNNALEKEGVALLAPVLRGMTCLQTLNLNYTRIGDVGMASLAPALAALPHLHTLDLSGNQLRSKAMSALQPVLAREGSPLRNLDIGHNLLELDGAHALAAGLGASSHLSGLSLSYVHWGNMGWAALAPALSCLAPSLQLLELGYERLDAFALAALTPALQQLTGLTSLKACGALSSADMITISPALRSMRQLQVLNLYGRGLSADGLADFAAVLPVLTGSLTHLDLSSCNMNANSAANALAPALAQATGLVELLLGGNAFGPQGSQWLVPVLSALPHLRELDFNSCKLGLQGCMAVVRALKDRDGMLVYLDDNGVTYGSSEGNELCHTAGVIVRL